MDLPPLGIVRERVPLPQMLWSSERARPFLQCRLCDRLLLVAGTQYLVEKTFFEGQPVLELAICLRCHGGLQLSRASLRRINAHFEERVDLVDRREALLARTTTDLAPWIEQCVLTKQRRGDCLRYHVLAQCEGTELLFAYLPYMISGEGLDGVARLLSKKSRGLLEDFEDRLLGPRREGDVRVPPVPH